MSDIITINFSNGTVVTIEDNQKFEIKATNNEHISFAIVPEFIQEKGKPKSREFRRLGLQLLEFGTELLKNGLKVNDDLTTLEGELK